MSSVAPTTSGQELWLRHVKLDDRSVAILRAIDYGTACVVQAEVFPPGGAESVHPGPYNFADVNQASAFVTEAVNSLMHLGCDVFAE